MKRILLIPALCCLMTVAAYSQTDEKKWNVGIMGGLVQYNGDLGHNFYQTDQAAYAWGGLSVSTYLTRHMDVSMFLTRGEVGYIAKDMPTSAERPNSFLARHNTANLVGRFYATGPRAIVRPYALVGVGLIWYEAVHEFKKEHWVYSLPTFGAGINFALSPVVSLQIQETFLYTTADHIDGITNGNAEDPGIEAVVGDNDMHLYHTAALTFNLGKKKDEDKDGVSDKKDQCPNTPPGVAVDMKGCPLDADNDGVADYMDACPDIAGLSSLKGCPDKDLDGITDKEDRCPDVFGDVAYKGCPDTDKDGVVDIDDKCPGTMSGYKVDATGCTVDSDGDGVVNEDDACPQIAGILAFKGCPDSDGDGVSDNEDRCPSAKGTIDNKGCPEMAREDMLRITVIASKIYFETNSDKLKLISNSQLDDLAEILKRYEGVHLTIEGHTDSDGDDAYNIDLSQRRTESVKNYLASRGIDTERLTAKGFGETMPVASNKNAAGKAKNRRVELKTSYK